MCGRARLNVPGEELEKIFDATLRVPMTPNDNIAPTDPMLILRRDPDGKREMLPVRWGLVPHWSTDATDAAKHINARWETLASKGPYRDAFTSRRCLCIVDGYYEWKTIGKQKLPFLVTPANDGAPFALAGLYERWRPQGGEPLETCTVITRAASGAIAEIHNRMPVVLPQVAYEAWLNPESTARELRDILEHPLLETHLEQLEQSPGTKRPRQLNLF